jgi:hypothetical protein
MCLVPIRGWPHRVTRASNGCAGGGALSVRAVGAKLRRVGPMTTANGAYCVLQEARVTRPVVWAGGLHSGWNARMRAGWGVPRAVFSVGPSIRWTILPRFSGEKENFSVAIQAPSLGRERPLWLGGAPRVRFLPAGGAFFLGGYPVGFGWGGRARPCDQFGSFRGVVVVFTCGWTRGEGPPFEHFWGTRRTEGVEG